MHISCSVSCRYHAVSWQCITFRIMHISCSVSCIYHAISWQCITFRIMHISCMYHEMVSIRAQQSVIHSRKIGQKKIAIYHAVSRYAYECRGRHLYHAYISIYQYMVSRLRYHVWYGVIYQYRQTRRLVQTNKILPWIVALLSPRQLPDRICQRSRPGLGICLFITG